MNNFITKLFELDNQALALYLQAFATIAIGLLAWTTARGQNIIAEKAARRELFKLRYENIYQEANLLFLSCNVLTDEYDKARNIENNQKRKEKIADIKNKYFEIRQKFYKKMEFNKFLLKPKDFDKLNSFCDKYLTHVQNYIEGKQENEICRNYYVATCFNEHYEIIPQILSSYLYHENENKLSFLIYKLQKYLKTNCSEFLLDYFPSIMDILGTILLIICLFLGFLYSLLEFIKEILKAPISLKNGKFEFSLRHKSKYLKRNRPWPL